MINCDCNVARVYNSGVDLFIYYLFGPFSHCSVVYRLG